MASLYNIDEWLYFFHSLLNGLQRATEPRSRGPSRVSLVLSWAPSLARPLLASMYA